MGERSEHNHNGTLRSVSLCCSSSYRGSSGIAARSFMVAKDFNCCITLKLGNGLNGVKISHQSNVLKATTIQSIGS